MQDPPNPSVSSPDEELSCDPEPRRGDRYIAWGAQIRASLRRVFMEVVRRVPTYFRTRQVGGTCILHSVSR